MSTWLSAAREAKREAVRKRSPEIYIQPLYEGEIVTLIYEDLWLNMENMDKKLIRIMERSDVPVNLSSDEYIQWGGFTPKYLEVKGRLLVSPESGNTRFVALRAHGKKGKEYHNHCLTMQLLYARGFYTPMRHNFWMPTEEITAKSLQKNLTDKRFTKLIKNSHGKYFKVEPPVGFLLFDCIGWPH